MNPFARIPFDGQYLSPSNPQSTQLKSGQVFIFPQGNFLVKPGAQTAIQFQDDYSGLWRTFEAGPVNHPIFLASDGSNFRAINLSGTMVGANITAAGSAYTQANTTATFAAPAAGITATCTPIIGGSLTFAVTTAGSGYTNPYILIPPPQLLGGTPGLCIPATANMAISAGALSTISTGFAGAGYITAPGVNTTTVTPAQLAANPSLYQGSTSMLLVDPAGTGGVITATIANGTPTSGGVTGLVMNSNGSGYVGTAIPAITITSATGSSGAATALPCFACTSVTIGGTNTGYTASIELLSTLTSGAANIVAPFGDPVLARAIKGVATQTAGALNAVTIEDAGFGFQTVPLIKQVGNATIDGSVTASFTAVVGGVTNSLIFWQVG